MIDLFNRSEFKRYQFCPIVKLKSKSFGFGYRNPILKNGKITKDFFYQSVMYVDSDIKKRVLLNEHYFESLKEKKLLHENTHETGLKLWCFKMKDFYKEAITFFNDDIYNYLEYEPKIKPYQK